LRLFSANSSPCNDWLFKMMSTTKWAKY
jgi:hypothetical protein